MQVVKMPESIKKNLSIDEAAKVYGLSKSWLYKKSMERSIPILKVGSRVLIPVVDFEKWLARCRADKEGRR